MKVFFIILVVVGVLLIVFAVGTKIDSSTEKNSNEYSYVDIKMFYSNGDSDVKTFKIETECIKYIGIRQEANIMNTLPPELIAYRKSKTFNCIIDYTLESNVEHFKIIKIRDYVSKNKN
jgi:hypothetical protein